MMDLEPIKAVVAERDAANATFPGAYEFYISDPARYEELFNRNQNAHMRYDTVARANLPDLIEEIEGLRDDIAQAKVILSNWRIENYERVNLALKLLS